MSEHRLQQARQVIENLSALGRGLGYFVQCEQPVLKDKRSPPAVDIAWKKDETQEFPLMIFEVESSAGNTIANNALKVFSQANQDFEKPLFFFHLVVHAGKDTSRIDALQRQYGTNNYRLYRLDTKEATHLIQDILTQHRRLTPNFAVAPICKLLRDGWDSLDLNAILDRAEALQFHTTFLDAYAHLSSADQWFLGRFLARLFKLEQASQLRHMSVKYGTFLGESWHPPIHLAILGRARSDLADSFLEQLCHWQERSYHCTMIGPHFGMSRDYDYFILCMASGFWSSIAAIFGSRDTKRYIAQQLQTICEHLHNARDRFALYAGTWLLHVAAGGGDEPIFEYARKFINDRGGISSDCVADPPFIVPSFDDLVTCEWDERICRDKCPIPRLHEFVQGTRYLSRGNQYNTAVRLGVGLLTENEFSDWFASATVTILESEREQWRQH